VADEQKSSADEIAEILANDPRAHVVEGETQAWLLTGKALEVAREAAGKAAPDRRYSPARVR
jgi:hypothetical protein